MRHRGDRDAGRIFTPGYVLYLVLLCLLATAVGRRLWQAWRPLTLEDMARDDYENVEGRMLRKIDRDRMLHDLAPDVTTMRDGVEYATNGAGMRDDREYAPAKPPGVRRAVFIGDSFTFGWGLELRYTFVKQLAARLERRPDTQGRWELLNLGVPGYNTIAEVASLEDKGLRYAPDLVVLSYHLNDAESPQTTRLGAGPETYRRLMAYFAGEAGAAEGAEVERFLADEGWSEAAAEIRREVARLPPDFHGALHVAHFVTHRLPLYWAPLEASLDRLQDLAQTHGFRVLVGIIPALDISWEQYPYGALHRQVRAAMEARGFTVVDYRTVFEQHPTRSDLQLWGHDGHTSAFADGLIAAVLEAQVAGHPQ